VFVKVCNKVRRWTLADVTFDNIYTSYYVLSHLTSVDVRGRTLYPCHSTENVTYYAFDKMVVLHKIWNHILDKGARVRRRLTYNFITISTKYTSLSNLTSANVHRRTCYTLLQTLY
jgi:hypothetical protein